LAGGDVQSVAATPPLGQGIDQESDHIDQQHRRDSLVFVEVDGPHTQHAFGHSKALLDLIFVLGRM